MTKLNLVWLAGFTAVYLALLPTNHGTYLRSIAFGGALFFAACAVIWSLWERGRRPEARIPAPPWSITLPLIAWFGWSALSYFWSVRPDYTAGQLAREITENLLVIAGFFRASRNAETFRGYTIVALATFAVMAALAFIYEVSAEGFDPSLKHNGVGPYSTYIVLTAPLLLTLIAPAPLGLRRRGIALSLGAALLALMIAAARLTDNPLVWLALAPLFPTPA